MNHYEREQLPKPCLLRYKDGDYIREATLEELKASIAAAKRDGGAGVIIVDGESCYVPGDLEDFGYEEEETQDD